LKSRRSGGWYLSGVTTGELETEVLSSALFMTVIALKAGGSVKWISFNLIVVVRVGKWRAINSIS
jgi:hypothetical protein